jgi:8-oxo-dGTP diphosphatase
VARHLLRRPVVGLMAYARTPSGEVVLIRRGDTGEWALPGGTLEWGETMRVCLKRELLEEAGVELASEPRVVGVYSSPDRDLRFHAVTVVVDCQVSAPVAAPMNPLEVLEVRAFREAELPPTLAHRSTDMMDNARKGTFAFE